MSMRTGVPEDVFKAVMGNVPAAVTVVTALDPGGGPVGLTVSAFSVVSLHPQLVLVCVDKGSQTLPAVRARGRFTVNFLAAGSEDLALSFASKSARKFDGVAARPAALPGSGPVLAAAASGYVSCEVTQEVEAGDHWIFLGQVRDGAMWEGRAPLTYCRRTFAAWHPPQRPPRGPGAARRPAAASGRALGLMLAIER